MVTLNPIAEDHNAVSNWLQVMCDDFLLGRDTSVVKYEDMESFYTETICKEDNDFTNINVQGYHCI